MANTVQGNTIRVDTTGNVRIGGGQITKAQLVAAAAAATAAIRDGLVGTDPLIDEIACPANDIRGSTNSKAAFFKGLHVTLTGAGAILYLTIR